MISKRRKNISKMTYLSPNHVSYRLGPFLSPIAPSLVACAGCHGLHWALLALVNLHWPALQCIVYCEPALVVVGLLWACVGCYNFLPYNTLFSHPISLFLEHSLASFHILYFSLTLSFFFSSIASLWFTSFHMILSSDSSLFIILCSMLHFSRYINL